MSSSSMGHKKVALNYHVLELEEKMKSRGTEARSHRRFHAVANTRGPVRNILLVSGGIGLEGIIHKSLNTDRGLSANLRASCSADKSDYAPSKPRPSAFSITSTICSRTGPRSGIPWPPSCFSRARDSGAHRSYIFSACHVSGSCLAWMCAVGIWILPWLGTTVGYHQRTW